MTTRLKLLVMTLLAAVAASRDCWAQGGNSRVFGDLLKRTPERSNVLMLVNVDGLFDSPMGRREGWRQEAIANHGGGLGFAADVSRAAVAVGMDFHSLHERWKVGLIQLRRKVPVKLADLAAREGGYVETVENTPVAWTPRDLYIFDFPDNLVGFASPTERQGLAGWYYAQNQKYAVASSPSGYYGGYNAYYGNSRAHDASVTKKQSDAMMSVDLEKHWQSVETSVADIRRKMVEKYQADF